MTIRFSKSLLPVIVVVLCAFGGCSKAQFMSPRLYVLKVAGSEQSLFMSETAPTPAKLERLVTALPPSTVWTFEVYSTQMYSRKPGKAGQLLQSASGNTLATLGATVALVLKE